MGPLKRDGTWLAGRRREQIGHAERVVEHPTSLVGGEQNSEPLDFLPIRGRGSAAEFEHYHED